MQGSITGGSNRDMGTLFRAVTGFAIALTLLHGPSFWSGLKTRSFLREQTDIEAARPGMRLSASWNEFLSPQKGTKDGRGAREIRARHLQF
jgi:hypothetical protein